MDPEVFSSLTDHQFSALDIVTMRNFVCRELKNRPAVVTPHQFVTAFFAAFPMHKLPQVQRYEAPRTSKAQPHTLDSRGSRLEPVVRSV